MSRRFLFLLALLAASTHLFGQIVPAKFRVSGKVVNAVNGHALAGAEVWFGKAENFEPTQQKLLTADDGAFTFMIAEPGKYLLAGQANGFRRQGFEQHGIYASAIVVGAGQSTGNVVFRLRPDARVLGVVEDDGHEPVQGATIYLFRTDASFGLRQTSLAEQTVSDDRGHYRLAHLEPGCYYLVVAASPWFSGMLQGGDAVGNSSQKSEFDVAFPTTFYPGVTDAASASQIALNEGEDFTADFTLNAVPALRVRVNQVNVEPQQFIGATLQQRIFGTEINEFGQRQLQVDGSQEIRGVAPGRYVLDILSADASSRAKRAMLLDLTADAEVDPDSTSAVASIHGEVQMEGGAGWPAQGIVRLWNSRTDEVLQSQIGGRGQIQFDSDFLTPGTYSVYAMNGENSIVSSLKAKGAQVVGQTVQVTGGTPVELEISLSNTLAKINGTALRDGKPVAGAMILLVPEAAEVNLPKFRRDQSDSDGTFTLRDVLPGRYRMLAIDDGWELEWANLSLLKHRLEHAQKIEIQPSKTYQTNVNVE
ncbi:MAG TPA: hypothetical protein VJP02_12610 [Candidatus Sulfotelmatobacter sp.]|nr:hypothetical protein [Candidatus Sulfotelmatobacter sp.]